MTKWISEGRQLTVTKGPRSQWDRKQIGTKNGKCEEGPSDMESRALHDRQPTCPPGTRPFEICQKLPCCPGPASLQSQSVRRWQWRGLRMRGCITYRSRSGFLHGRPHRSFVVFRSVMHFRLTLTISTNNELPRAQGPSNSMPV